jgi:hypothetical protein
MVVPFVVVVVVVVDSKSRRFRMPLADSLAEGGTILKSP